MAEGGSNSWGSFEIVLVILLLIGFLSQLENHYSKSQEQAKDKTVVSSKASSSTKKNSELTKSQVVTDSSSCGLNINSPRSLEKITSYVTVDGATYGCDWQSTPQTALYAQMIDSHGLPVSEYTAIIPTTVEDGITRFSSKIYITNSPNPGTGYLILVPAIEKDSKQGSTIRIPLTFNLKK